nr:hypothetical protein [Candidatus Sigynarchaeum springense]
MTLVLVGGVPVIGGICTLAVFSRFPLGKGAFEEQQARLKVLHDERRARLAGKQG